MGTLWLSGEQGSPSIRVSVVRSPSLLAHVDVSLGKTLNAKFAPVAELSVSMLVNADVQVEPWLLPSVYEWVDDVM